MTEISFSQIVRFVWSYFRRFRWLVLLVYLAMSLTVVLEIMNPLVLGWLTDAITPTDTVRDFREIMLLVVLLFGQGIFFHLSYRTAAFLNCYIDSRVEGMVAAETFDRLQRFSMDWHANTFAGSNVTKIKRGMRAIHTFYDTVCYHFFPTVGSTMILIILITLRQPVLGLVFGTFTVCYAVFSITTAIRFVTPANRLENQKDNRLGGALADALSSNLTVKSFAQEEREYGYFRRISKDYARAAQHSWVRGNILALSQNFIINILKFLVMAGAVWFWSRGVFTPGDVIFIFTSYQVFSHNLSELGNRVIDFNRSRHDLEDVVRFWQTPLQILDRKNAKPLQIARGKIEWQQVSFLYPEQNLPVFEGLTLTIKPREKVALVGHSGSGKTTFVKLLQRFYEVQSGAILIDGQDVATVTQKSLRENMALVPQDPLLFHRTLAENIAYGKPDATLEEIAAAARKAHAHEFIKDLPKGYQTLVGERGIKLSGGERQRVAIARAILADSPILILDEATSSLDSKSERLIQDALNHLMKNRTAIIIAHRLSTIKMADRILVFENGKIVEEGSHSQLVRKKKGIYRELYELQAGGFIGE